MSLMLRKLLRWLARKIPLAIKERLFNALTEAGYAIQKSALDGHSPQNDSARPWRDPLNASLLVAIAPERCLDVTQYFYDKLSPQSLSKLHDLLERRPDLKAQVRTTTEALYKRELLRFGANFLAEDFDRETGLAAFSPPDQVHAMVRGIYSGDLEYCDLIVEGIKDARQSIEAGRNYLDFGCSSGRVVRTLAIAYPQACFYGCDPNPGAIAWASEHIPQVRFAQSDINPPLPYRNDFFSAVFAISIWSHFGKQAAWDWLTEIRRVLKPGGLLIFTAHGVGSLAYYREQGAMAETDIQHCLRETLEHGFSFIDVFGEQGDWGIKHSEWGCAFMHPVYVIQELLTDWKLIRFSSRRAEYNQDVYVLEKTQLS